MTDDVEAAPLQPTAAPARDAAPRRGGANHHRTPTRSRATALGSMLHRPARPTSGSPWCLGRDPLLSKARRAAVVAAAGYIAIAGRPRPGLRARPRPARRPRGRPRRTAPRARRPAAPSGDLPAPRRRRPRRCPPGRGPADDRRRDDRLDRAGPASASPSRVVREGGEAAITGAGTPRGRVVAPWGRPG